MNYYDSIKLDIYESYDNGEITYAEKEYLLEKVNEVIYEKHVSPKRRKENLKRRNELNRKHFEQKYKYDPETKTIELNGKRVPVDLDSSTIAIEPDNSKLHTDKFFYRIKSPKQQKAIIDHEVGHGSLQATGKNAPLRNPKLETDQGLYATASNKVKTAATNRFLAGFSHPSNNEIKKDTKRLHNELRDSLDYDKNKPLTKEQKLRNDILQKLSKHEVNSNDHANRSEFEADLYASQQQKTGKGQLLAGTKNIGKIIEDDLNRSLKNDKSYKKDGSFNEERYRKKYLEMIKGLGEDSNDPMMKSIIDTIDTAINDLKKTTRKDAYKQQHMSINKIKEDLNIRKKALNDKSITDEEKSIYRNKK